MGRNFGYFCFVTTFTAKPEDLYGDPGARARIEKFFLGGKTDRAPNVADVLRDETLEGCFIVTFVALTILTDLLYRRERKTCCMVDGEKVSERTLAEEMSFEEIRNVMSSIGLRRDVRGNQSRGNGTDRERSVARRLGFENLYDTVPNRGAR